MSRYQLLILQFVITVCVLALLDNPHASNYWVKGDECTLLVLNVRECAGRHCDITYCGIVIEGCNSTAETAGRTAVLIFVTALKQPPAICGPTVSVNV
jgi:hypothetical protein